MAEQGVESDDSLQYIRNFLNKTRVRASGRDLDDDDNSDDLLSDDELVVSMQTLQEATKTHVGGKKPGTMGDDQDLEKGISHHENSTNAIGHVDAVWAPASTTGREAKKSVSGHNMKELFKAARLSRRGGDI